MTTSTTISNDSHRATLSIRNGPSPRQLITPNPPTRLNRTECSTAAASNHVALDRWILSYDDPNDETTARVSLLNSYTGQEVLVKDSEWCEGEGWMYQGDFVSADRKSCSLTLLLTIARIEEPQIPTAVFSFHISSTLPPHAFFPATANDFAVPPTPKLAHKPRPKPVKVMEDRRLLPDAILSPISERSEPVTSPPAVHNGRQSRSNSVSSVQAAPNASARPKVYFTASISAPELNNGKKATSNKKRKASTVSPDAPKTKRARKSTTSLRPTLPRISTMQQPHTRPTAPLQFPMTPQQELQETLATNRRLTTELTKAQVRSEHMRATATTLLGHLSFVSQAAHLSQRLTTDVLSVEERVETAILKRSILREKSLNDATTIDDEVHGLLESCTWN